MLLRLKALPRVPVEAECISPDSLLGKSLEEARNLELWVGNKRRKLGELFEVGQGSEGAEELVLEGDLSRVKHVGAGMSFGRIVVKGDVGMHLGRHMKGGEIVVHGNVGDWAGAEMRGGMIRIKGNAGNLLGAAYRGSRSGMNRGIIVVEGDAGHEVGELMRRGIIVVVGDLGSFAGAHMRGGTILCFGKIGERAGAEMDRGTIVAFKELELLPTFSFDASYNPAFLRLLLKELKGVGLPIKQEHIEGIYDRYSGDLAGLGKGEIFVWRGERGSLAG